MKQRVFKTGAAFVILSSVLVSTNAWGLSLAPGLFMVQNVTPGQPVDVKKKSGVVFTVKNDGETEAEFTLQCQKPSATMADWELGYEEIPDPSWCKLEKEEFTVPAKSSAEVGLSIDVPGKPEYYNCKWMLAVVLTSGKNKGRVGVGLAVAARVQIETAPFDDPKTGGAAAIAAIPGMLDIEGKPGGAFEKTVLIANNTDRALDCVTGGMLQVYPDDKDYRYPRFVSHGYQLIVKETWLKERDQKFSLKPGEKHEHKVAGTIPATAKVGEKWEELVFVTAPGPVVKEKPARETRTFFRIRFHIVDEVKKE